VAGLLHAGGDDPGTASPDVTDDRRATLDVFESNR
jgi:hypothetical protein